MHKTVSTQDEPKASQIVVGVPAQRITSMSPARIMTSATCAQIGQPMQSLSSAGTAASARKAQTRCGACSLGAEGGGAVTPAVPVVTTRRAGAFQSNSLLITNFGFSRCRLCMSEIC